jgi:hypothetical protein
MRRVSSRQRLVSWDAFDANEIYASDYEDRGSHLGDSDDSSADEYETALSSSSSEIESIDDDGIDITIGNFTTTNTTTVTTSFDSEITGSDTAVASHMDIATTSSRKRDRSVLTNRRTRKAKGANYRDKTNSSHVKNRNEPPTVVGTVKKHVSAHSTSITKSTSATSISSFATAVPALISGYSWEITQSTSSSTDPPTFNTLMADVHLDIFAFCDLTSLRTIMSLNRHYRDLVQSENSQSALWLYHCQHKWNNAVTNESSCLPTFVDQLHLPTAAPSVVAKIGTRANINLALLLTMTPDDLPTGVDVSLLNVQQSRRNWRLEQQVAQRPNQQRQRLPSPTTCDFVHYHDKTTGLQVVRYVGPIGAGDRCIRSNFPLPRPQLLHRDAKPSGLSLRFGGRCMDQKGLGAGNFLRLLRRGAHKMVGGSHGNSNDSSRSSKGTVPSTLQWRPFVCPFVATSSGTKTATLNVTPRLGTLRGSFVICVCAKGWT